MEYVYKSTEERVYPDRGLTVNFGDVADWPDGPPADGHWVPTEATQDELDRLAAEQAAAEAKQQAADAKKTGEQPPTEPPPPDPTASPAKTAAKTTKE